MFQLWYREALGWVKHVVIRLFLVLFKISFPKSYFQLRGLAGTPALTSRGFVEEDFAKVAEFFDLAVNLALKVKAATTGSPRTFLFFLFFCSPRTHFRVSGCPYMPHGLYYWCCFSCNLGGTKLKDFVATLNSDSNIQAEIAKLRHNVEEYAKQFPTIGFEKETMKYKN